MHLRCEDMAVWMALRMPVLTVVPCSAALVTALVECASTSKDCARRSASRNASKNVNLESWVFQLLNFFNILRSIVNH